MFPKKFVELETEDYLTVTYSGILIINEIKQRRYYCSLCPKIKFFIYLVVH